MDQRHALGLGFTQSLGSGIARNQDCRQIGAKFFAQHGNRIRLSRLIVGAAIADDQAGRVHACQMTRLVNRSGSVAPVTPVTQ